MLMDRYFDAMRGVLTLVENTQRTAIIAAAEQIAARLAQGAAWHLLDTGHMLMSEGVGRTGGLMAVRPIKITCEIENPVRYRPGAASGAVGYDGIPGFADYVIGRSNIVAGDIVMLGSVSGYNYFPVDLALKTRAMGCLTVALTSVAYSRELTSKHPSGKRLFEACEYVLDNCANYGDALVPVEALGRVICPASGVSASYLFWALQSTVIERLLAMGKAPGVYLSNHLPDAAEQNERALEQYEALGY